MDIASKLFAISIAIWIWGIIGPLVIRNKELDEFEEDPMVSFYNGVKIIGFYSSGFFGLGVIILTLLST